MIFARPAIAALALSLPLLAAAGDALKPFPPAADGEQRYAIDLPPLADEAARKVELIAGRTMEIDCNQYRMGGRWEEQTVQGWGYTYHRLIQVGPVVGTLMACPPGSRRQAFVAVGGEPVLVRYNSKLPLVIHAPADVEVRYRIWSAAPESKPAPRR